MARATEAERVKTMEGRIRSANKLYDNWAQRFETATLEEYYLGRQHQGITEEAAKKMYVINLVFSSIEVNKPSLIFNRPQVRIQPRPQHNYDLGSQSEARARLCQDTVQTFIDDPDIGFDLETSLALQEAHFRFGVVEVGYTANYIDNPDAGKPVLKESADAEVGEPLNDEDGNPVIQPPRITKDENLFLKRIPANSFRCSISSKNKMSRNDWVGYYEWQYVEDLKRNKEYENTSGLKSTGVISKEYREDGGSGANDMDELEQRHGMVKVWKIWDLRGKKRHVLAEGHKKFLQENKPFNFLPLTVIKFHEILNSFYPVPPVFQWLGPQNEINETREMQRAHRRRFYRRYTYTEGSIEAAELEKLETGGDGVYARANMRDPLQPVPDAPLSGDVWQHLNESKADFIAVSAIGGEQRGVAESDTATQATIIDQRSRLRESAARTKVAGWLSQIARIMLLTIKEEMALPIWVKRSSDPFSQGAAEGKAELWRQIQSEELGDLDLDVFIDLASMSPVTEEVERNAWNQVLMLMTNPSILMVLGQSEVLLRKTLAMYGIRSENEIQEIIKVMQQALGMVQQQASLEAAKKMGTGGGASPGTSAASTVTGHAGGQAVGPDDISAIMGAITQGGVA